MTSFGIPQISHHQKPELILAEAYAGQLVSWNVFCEQFCELMPADHLFGVSNKT